MTDTMFTPSGVRMRRHSASQGVFNWLLLPGGPGIGSESLEQLASVMAVPGTIWLVDLPGDGSNRNPPGAPADPFSVWPGVVAEAAQALPNVIFVGHSTGGMYLLAAPELEQHISGLVLLSTAPDCSWQADFAAMTQRNPLQAVTVAAAIYEADRCDRNIAAIATASAPWNFTPGALDDGTQLLARMPYNSAAIDWSAAHFDHIYRAAWWPGTLPVLILAGADDRIVSQIGWNDPRFRGKNVRFETIAAAGHFPWIDNPAAATTTLAEFASYLLAE